jgi:hypothetical protein
VRPFHDIKVRDGGFNEIFQYSIDTSLVTITSV